MKLGKGFTLIELVVALAIVAILATIALASYQYAIVKSRRGSAKAFLMDAITREQQYLLDARAYAATLSDLNLAVPADVSSFYTVTRSEERRVGKEGVSPFRSGWTPYH